MSGFGQSYNYLDPDSQEQLSAIKRRQAYAQALLQQGGSDPGSAAYGGLANAGRSILGAFLANKADKSERDVVRSAQDKYTQDLGAFLGGGSQQPPPQPMTPPVSVSNAAGSGPQMDAGPVPTGTPQPTPIPNATGPSPSPQAIPNAQGPAPSPAPLQMAQNGQQSPMDRLLATHNPALIQQFAPQLFTHQMDINDKKVIPLSDQEATALGLRLGGVYGREAATGNLTVIQPSDMKSKGAMAQTLQEKIDEASKVPMTAAETSAHQDRQATTGLGYAQLNKPVDVSFGSTLVDPKSGKILYQSAADPSSIDQMVDWSIAHGGQIPPNARSPAIQQAFNSALGKRLSDLHMTNDDLVNKNIAIGARRGAATQAGKQQAGTQINEDAVVGGMNILNGLLQRGAAGTHQFKSLNDLNQYIGRNTNDSDAINLKNAISTISNEYARVMTGQTGGSASSDSARNEASGRLLTGFTKGTMQDVMGQMHYEMRQRTDAQRGALGQLTGGQYNGVNSSIQYNDPNQKPPSDVDPKVWAHMTPQERALWHH